MAASYGYDQNESSWIVHRCIALHTFLRALCIESDPYIATYIFGLGTFAGTVAIAVFTFAYCGKILYEQIETADMGSYEALEALGMGRLSTIRYAIWPQVFPQFISTVLFCFEGNVRYASILGYVGAGGLGLILNERIGWMEYARVGMILIALFITVVIIETVSSYLRSKLI